ncbi:MAG TPA: hypothetical protein DEH11_16590 [Actinobacteria bacterium]|nr:hypothetical protein [Actinomycetota bacterium]
MGVGRPAHPAACARGRVGAGPRGHVGSRPAGLVAAGLVAAGLVAAGLVAAGLVGAGRGVAVRPALGRDDQAVVTAELLCLRGGHVPVSGDLRSADDLLRIERDGEAVRGDAAAAQRHEPARLPRPDSGPRGRPVNIIIEHELNRADDLAIGPRYPSSHELFRLHGHGDISPRVAITGRWRHKVAATAHYCPLDVIVPLQIDFTPSDRIRREEPARPGLPPARASATCVPGPGRLASMSRYGGIVQPDHSDSLRQRPAGRAGLLRPSRLPRHLRGPGVPVFPRARSRTGGIRDRMAGQFPASAP